MKSLDSHVQSIIRIMNSHVKSQVEGKVLNAVAEWRWGKVAAVRVVKDNVTILITQMEDIDND